MLIVCNGAQKGGSTWIFNLVKIIRPSHKIPSDYQTKGFKSSAIADDRLLEFLEKTSWRQNDFVCKQHWTSKINVRVLANDEDSRFINIIRDIRDVLTSRYHHDIRLKNVPADIDFKSYYHGRGLVMMRHYCSYQLYWHRDFGESDVEPLLMSYEGLKAEFRSQLTTLGNFLDVPEESIDFERAYSETAIENLSGFAHYRKGITGDWLGHFDPEIAAHFENELRTNGYLDFVANLKDRGIFITDEFIEGGWADKCAPDDTSKAENEEAAETPNGQA